MNSNGTNPIKLTDSAGGTHCDRRPYFNPAGNKITFHADREFGIEVYVMDSNGANLIRLTDSPGNTASFYSSFSPDGSEIVFASDRADDAEIYVMDPDGTGQTRVTFSAGADLMPTWSVDPNSAPTISATVQEVARDTSGSVSIASVNDAEDDESNLSVTVDSGSSSTTNGVTVSGIAVDSGGAVTANIAATCSASDASFTLRVTDSGTLFADATLSVFITAEIEDPVLSLPSNIVTSLPADSADLTKVVEFTVSATDNCDAAPAVVADPPTGSAFSVGTTTVNVTATDASGNTAIGSFTVTVLYNFTGFFQPVDNLPAVNGAGAGQAIPVKFSLSGNKGLNIFATGFPASQQIDCIGGAPVESVEETVTAGSSTLSYDPASDRYVYVWKTERWWKGTCRQLMVKLNDGSVHSALFQFK
jgi:hypothetical protein